MKSQILVTSDFFFSSGIGVSMLSRTSPGFNTPEKEYSEMKSPSIFTSTFSDLANSSISSCFFLFSNSLLCSALRTSAKVIY